MFNAEKRGCRQEDIFFAVCARHALPFTMLMGLMCVSLGKAMWRDHLRETK